MTDTATSSSRAQSQAHDPKKHRWQWFIGVPILFAGLAAVFHPYIPFFHH